MLLPLEKNVRFGLLCVACVPGGGLGHVAVIISDADISLSLTMNLISTVTMLGKIINELVFGTYLYTVKPVLSGHSKIDKIRLMQVKSIAECSPWSILQYF